MIHHDSDRESYTSVNNKVVRNYDLSLSALGLLVRLLEKPANWEIRPSWVEKVMGITSRERRRIFQELESSGHLVVSYVRHGNRADVAYDLYETPVLAGERTSYLTGRGFKAPVGIPVAEEPATEERSVVENKEHLVNDVLCIHKLCMHKTSPLVNTEGIVITEGEKRENTRGREESTPQRSETLVPGSAKRDLKSVPPASAPDSSKTIQPTVRPAPTGDVSKLIQILEAVCSIDVSMLLGRDEVNFRQAVSVLAQQDRVELRLPHFRRYWDSEHWKGQKGQAPSPVEVCSEWARFLVWGEQNVGKKRGADARYCAECGPGSRWAVGTPGKRKDPETSLVGNCSCRATIRRVVAGG